MTVRVLIVDDSKSLRAWIKSILVKDPEIEVVGGAASAAEARAMIRELHPDVITLDVEMPDMNGMAFLDRIMRLRPMPVVMVSAYTGRGADATVEALEIGAVDCYSKPCAVARGLPFDDGGRLARMIKQAASSQPRPRDAARHKPGSNAFTWNGNILAIAASTGGVEALWEVLSKFPVNCPPTVVVQHMPEYFTESFARRLNARLPVNVVEAEDARPLEQGTVYIAPGGLRHLAVRGEKALRCRLIAGDAVNGHRPSADILFNSLAQSCPKKSVGVILTGMGEDGAYGLMAMRKAGGLTLGQNETTSLIYGMPKAAFELGAVQSQYALADIAKEALSRCGQ